MLLARIISRRRAGLSSTPIAQFKGSNMARKTGVFQTFSENEIAPQC